MGKAISPQSIKFAIVMGLSICIGQSFALNSFALGDLPAPQTYAIPYADKALVVDGKLDDASWQQAAFTSAFMHHDTGEPALLQTRAKLLYDNQCLYLGIETEDADIYAHYTHNADPIFLRDDLVEIFIDPDSDGKNYFEIGISARDIYYVFQVPDAADGMVRPQSLPQVKITAATKLKGTLNNPKDKDIGWTIEACIPLSSLIENTTAHATEIMPGSQWRIGLFRIDYDHTTPKSKALGFYSWQYLGKFGFHRPERFGVVTFGSQPKQIAK
jgi:hypothetical protein